MPQDSQHQELFNRFKEALISALENGQLSQQEGVLLCALLNYAEDVNQLKLLLKVLAQDYSVCAELVATEKETMRTKQSNKAQAYLRQLIQEDPVTAGE